MMSEQPAGVVSGLLGGAAAAAPMMLFGAAVDAMMGGLFAAVLISLWLPAINDRIKSGVAILLTALLAGYAAPVTADWLVATHSGFSHTQTLRMLIAIVIGLACPVLVPAAIEGGRRWLLKGWQQ